MKTNVTKKELEEAGFTGFFDSNGQTKVHLNLKCTNKRDFRKLLTLFLFTSKKYYLNLYKGFVECEDYKKLVASSNYEFLVIFSYEETNAKEDGPLSITIARKELDETLYGILEEGARKGKDYSNSLIQLSKIFNKLYGNQQTTEKS